MWVRASLKVNCDDVEYAFASIEDEDLIERDSVLATFHENGRLAIIAPREYLLAKSIENEGPYAKLTIDVHTSLELAGLTAVMATALAEKVYQQMWLQPFTMTMCSFNTN